MNVSKRKASCLLKDTRKKLEALVIWTTQEKRRK